MDLGNSVAADVETFHVLAGDVGVGADVDHVDAFDPVNVLETFDRRGDDAACDQTLAQAGLIGDQVPRDRGLSP